MSIVEYVRRVACKQALRVCYFEICFRIARWRARTYGEPVSRLFDGPPSWSIDASETGEGVVGLIAWE